MWLRVLFLAMAVLTAGVAYAQAPPASFFAGRSNDELRALARDPKNDVLLRRGAATKLVITLADDRAFDDAEAAGREFAKNVDALAIRHIVAVRRRSHVHVVALLALGVTLAFALAALSLAAAHGSLAAALPAVRRVAPVFLFFLGYMGLVGGGMAESYENSSSLPFALFAAFMLPLVVIFRVWSAVGSPALAARSLRGIAAVAATLALGFLVVEQVNPAYLEGFGL